jgi:hypothetical protein
MDSAPRDGTPVLVWHCHGADPYVEDEAKGILTTYAANCEGMGSEDRDGHYVAVFGGGHDEDLSGEGWGPWANMPDWWFKQDSDFEVALNPIAWAPLPPKPDTFQPSGPPEPMSPAAVADRPPSEVIAEWFLACVHSNPELAADELLEALRSRGYAVVPREADRGPDHPNDLGDDSDDR